MDVTERVIVWNKARYDQEYDPVLAMNLLLEETQELFTAQTDIDKLDAVGDITFVAIGVFWKLGLSHEEIKAIFHNMDLSTISAEQAYCYSLEVMDYLADRVDDIEGSYEGCTLALHCTFTCALMALRGLNMQHRFYDIVHIICDSNQTKEVKGKTPSNVKANIDKGTGYVPPTAALKDLYNIERSKQKESNHALN